MVIIRVLNYSFYFPPWDVALVRKWIMACAIILNWWTLRLDNKEMLRSNVGLGDGEAAAYGFTSVVVGSLQIGDFAVFLSLFNALRDGKWGFSS